MTEHTYDVQYLIIGAGVTGLSFASKVNKKDYLIIEKEKEVGGYCRTIKQDGFVWDYAGHFFHFNDPEIKKEFSALLNQPGIVHNRKCTKVFYNGKYIDAPFQYNIHQLEKEEFIDCLVGLFPEKQAPYQNFYQMLFSRYGEGISERFLIPYNEKLYACDLNRLDYDAMGRFFPSANREDIIRGFSREQRKTYNDDFFYSSEGAVSFINEIMKSVRKEHIFLDTSIYCVDLKKKQVQTSKGVIRYNYLINTAPFTEFLRLCNIPLDESLTCNQVLVFNFGFDSPPTDTETQWVYFPERDISFYRVGFYNNILHTDRMSLYVEIGFPSEVKIDVEKHRKIVLEDLKKVGIIDQQKLISENSVIMNPGYVHISNKSMLFKAEKQEQMRLDGVFSIGRYGDWKYCSIEDCIKQATDTANELLTCEE